MVPQKDQSKTNYIPLKQLEVYLLSREISKLGWKIYNQFSWQNKKGSGDQFIDATDSVGANITEGYYRFHYLDKIKFYYNARGSLGECSEHWLELLFERKLILEEDYQQFKRLGQKLSIKLNNFISSTYKAKAQS